MAAYKVESQIQLAVASANGDDEEIGWIAAVWQPRVELQDLQYTSPRFKAPNRKLAMEPSECL